MVTLITDGSPRAFKLQNQLDEAEITYEIQTARRNDTPQLIVENKVLNFTKAQRWIKKKVKENGEIC